MKLSFSPMPSAFLAVSLSCAAAAAAEGGPGYDPAIGKYIAFLEEQKQSPVDYVLNLFENYDVVILCERAHPETSQYDLILDIIRDRRFVDRVGNLCTEVGTASLVPRVEAFLMDSSLDERAVEEKALGIFRNLTFFPAWEKTNFFTFLKRLHGINKSLPEEDRIHLYPSDMPFSWEGMTGERYREFKKTLGDRDKAMADQVIGKLRSISSGSGRRKKALVIMNFRHAFPHLDMKSYFGLMKPITNTAGFIMEALPGKVANVMINALRVLPGSTDRRVALGAIADGKWDAAFAALGNPPRGFNFRGSPFGADAFDYFPLWTGKSYADIFTGFVFFEAPGNHRLSFGVPGMLASGFREELIRRNRIADAKATPEEIAKAVDRLESLRVFGYGEEEMFGKSNYQQKIDGWLKAPPSLLEKPNDGGGRAIDP